MIKLKFHGFYLWDAKAQATDILEDFYSLQRMNCLCFFEIEVIIALGSFTLYWLCNNFVTISD